MSQYFGFLEKEKFISWEKKKQVDLLVSKQACRWSSTTIGSLSDNEIFGDLNKAKLVFKPSVETINEFHEFIISKYDSLISNYFISFFKKFDEATYGLKTLEQRKHGLKLFNELYSTVNPSGIDFVRTGKKIGLVQTTKFMNRFEKLTHIRSGIKIDLCPLPIAMEYFYGNDDFFRSETFRNLGFFKKAIDFESKLKVLVNLNNRFQFEEDLHFSELNEFKKVFLKYAHIFNSFEVFLWTYKTIQDMDQNIPSQMDSLYAGLVEMEMVYNRKSNFIKYAETEHSIRLSKLRSFEEHQNPDHDARVQKFKTLLTELSLEKA
ncbi:hypothetical protein [Urechidicola vernalis]|uniref:Uncharacterized protein n=1 Tax=Urechidicola vernalis TaxID=3075600 RepID=A0ABU2Y2S5_9FLAO|nr:hypothetical protein [Urechidicola sp. P050]MDT0552090.1 hypothetical protein [Urechidicola sp. P050]